MKVLVTGGAGFIGSAVCRLFVGELGANVLNVDKLTYAGNLDSLAPSRQHPNYRLRQADICDRAAIAALLAEFAPDAVMHLAAEVACRPLDRRAGRVHQDQYRSAPSRCSTRRVAIGGGSPRERADRFRFHHVSTDEVFGALGPSGMFTEETPYKPNSPYSASKAASDHLVRAWHETFGLPAVITNCSNNYGPFHFPEKLIPLAILKALHGEPMPVYGKGDNVRDWLYVDDHARALYAVLTGAAPGESYNIGGDGERSNLDVVTQICALLDEMAPGSAHRPHAEADHLCARPARRTTGAMRWTRPGCTASSAGRRRRISIPACARPCAGTSTIAGGGSRSGTEAIPAPASARPPSPPDELMLDSPWEGPSR